MNSFSVLIYPFLLTYVRLTKSRLTQKCDNSWQPAFLLACVWIDRWKRRG